MKKFLILLLVGAVCSIFVTGCSTFKDPEFVGELAGKSTYLAYEKVAENQSDEFKAKVAEIWAYINTINDASDLHAISRDLNEKFEAAINSKDITEADKQVLIAVKNDICGRIDDILNNQFETNQEGIEFLIGVRKGVNSMITYANKTKK